MKAENKTEELLEHISKKEGLTVEQKKQEIEQFASPDKSVNYNAGQACATCPPSHARKEFVDELIDSLEPGYTVTIYTAYPGTPLNDDYGNPAIDKTTKERIVSVAGHMWFKISIISDSNPKPDSYGFAPIKSGMIGKGSVTNKDNIHYVNPYYSREIEVKKSQYEKLKEFGDTAVKKSNKYFSLYYNGVTNSCIDFTWQALRHAGLIPESIQEKKEADKFDGELKVIDNIPHIKSIPAPYPDSELNTENYNEIPDRARLHKLLSQNDDVKNSENIGIASRQNDRAINHV
ncbi:hypothetical protein PZA22_01600 [Pectobacterium polaris]|uniref:Uncharacterized protein n=1 Tax=Pectobacterium polaris TaxID=2042057 RepID=A0AAW4P1Z4_9GAMM|nr:hypothetical protein [Pectobacterium polaris]MBW5893349.1 hypothetical protein [Pectobacterium polaris]MDE8753207.1 hypothetical protein [Pectobacterium polaris]RJL23394.1 hypothetical protein D5074_10415 [Pectobacterium polaris]